MNRRTVLLGILFVLLFINIELSQPQSNTVLDQPTTSGNPTLSQSESVTIIQAIHAAELRTRDHIDQKYTELGTKISKIETKVTLLDKQVSDLEMVGNCTHDTNSPFLLFFRALDVRGKNG